jgi:hypothetical protein
MSDGQGQTGTIGTRVPARPGRFGEALREAVAQDRSKTLPKGQFAPTTGGS